MKYDRYPKRDALKDYFPVPNEIFCLGLSSGEIAVYKPMNEIISHVKETVTIDKIIKPIYNFKASEKASEKGQ